MLKRIILLITFILFSCKISAQSIQWENTIGGNDTDWNNFIEKTNDGNVIIGGYSYSNISDDKTENSNGLSDYWLVKLDPNTGNLIWQKTIGGNGVENLTSGFETSDNGFILGGYSSSNISGDKTENSRGNDDFWIVKLDANRNIVWQKTYGGSSTDRLTSLIQTNDGGYLISGDTYSDISGDKELANFGSIDIWVIKINSIGDIEWQKNFGGSKGDSNSKLLKTSNNTYILCATSSSDYSGNKTQNSKGLGDYWILNLDLNGNILWQKTIGGSNSDFTESLVETNDGNYLIAGYSTSGISGDKTLNTNGGTDIWLLKLNSANGSILWQKNIGGNLTDWQPIIKKTIDNNYIILAMSTSDISGQKTEANKGNRDYWLIKVDSNGQVIWDKTIGGDNLDEPQSIIEINPDEFICSGWSQSDASGDKSENKSGLQDNWVVKLSNCTNSNSVVSNMSVCINQNLNLTATVGTNYTWTGPNGFTSNIQNPTISNVNATHSGQYLCNIKAIGGCTIIQKINVLIQNTTAPSGNANQNFCIRQNATVANIITNGTNVVWYNSATSTLALPNSTLLSNNTTYYATQTINGCESVNRLAVTTNLTNTLNGNSYSETICSDLNNNVEIKNLTTYNSNLISSTGNTFSYYDTYNNALNQSSAGQIINFANYSLGIGTNIFYVRIDSPNTCFQIVTLTLELASKPSIPINDIESLCEEKNIILNGGNNYDSYTWSTGETTQLITIAQPGNYSVIVTKIFGTTICTSTKNFTVVNSNIATIQEIISSDWTDNNNTITVLLQSNSQGDYEYSINGIDFQNSNVFENLEAGEYTVFVRDKNGCGMVSKELYLLMYPKFFTPNGDGFNDFWKIKFSENEPNLTVKIFDRYGKFLKQFGINSMGWDGKYLGKDLSSADYWFVVTRENGKEYKGHFSLKR